MNEQDKMDETGFKCVEEKLKRMFPHGHPSFIPMTLDELQLHSEKNWDYAHGGDPLGNFKRRARIAKEYPGLDLGDPAVVAVWDAFKQIDAWLWMKCQGYEGKVEGKDQRLRDGHVYLKLGRILDLETVEE